MTDHLTIERHGAIATVSLNRPKVRNALSLTLMRDIIETAQAFREDTKTRVVIFTGTGDHFSGGADLKDAERAQLADADLLVRQRATQIGQRLMQSLLEIPQITIAAVNGYALGGGACIVSALDFRIGSETCRVGYPEIDLGMNLSWYGLPVCARLIGPARAKRMVIGGAHENAQTLHQWGFLDEVVPSDTLQAKASEWAERYSAKPPMAAQMIKRSVNAMTYMQDFATMHMDTDQFLLATHSAEHEAAVKAFRERKS